MLVGISQTKWLSEVSTFGLGIWGEFVKLKTVFTVLTLMSNLLMNSGSYFHSFIFFFRPTPKLESLSSEEEAICILRTNSYLLLDTPACISSEPDMKK